MGVKVKNNWPGYYGGVFLCGYVGHVVRDAYYSATVSY